MKQVRFLLEVAALLAVVPLLVIAKLGYSANRNTLSRNPASAAVSETKQSVSKPAESSATVFPGLINSKFIVVNY